ncbi:hypothetical protein RvY_03762 [Ramazzottius varieornatus]|uniref:Uncharacterized protein n=1 Tax=Ramazzottius varieornatus TaxID=947166 RepID=A0A1D1UP77_RAMVA|nr:hypothetical protein RvY_03762 [Ramazzottius varieornatus]
MRSLVALSCAVLFCLMALASTSHADPVDKVTFDSQDPILELQKRDLKWNSKGFNDYNHLRFGRRDPYMESPVPYVPLMYQQDKRAAAFGSDYAHLRFGRRVPSFTDYGHLRFG